MRRWKIKNTNAAVKGYMPRTNSEGFVFVGGADMDKERVSETLIHELCHGLYGLQHTFDYGVAEDAPSDNIMSYSNDMGRRPSKYFQWYNVENPSDYHLPFTDSAEDGESATNWWHWIPVDNWWQTDIQSKVSKNEDLFETLYDKQGKLDELRLENWTIEKDYKDSPKKWLEIKDKESVAFSDFKKNHVYTWKGNVENDTKVYNTDRDQEKNCIYTGVNFFSFVDAPSLSDYKVDEMANLDKHMRVVAVYYGDKFGLISFFDAKENLVFAMQIYPLITEGKNIKQITESWVRSLLVREGVEEKKEESTKKKEYKPINDGMEHYIVSDPDARIRVVVNDNGVEKFDGHPDREIVPQCKEVLVLSKETKYNKEKHDFACNNSKEVPLICGFIKDVNEKNNYPDCYTSMTNLTKIIILSDDKIKTFTLNKNVECYELPFSNIKTKNQPKQGIEAKAVATCGQYVRIVSKDLDEFGEDFESKGYWVKISDTDMYPKDKNK